jgi:metal-sulfur cluster biosynthetic enzyme
MDEHELATSVEEPRDATPGSGEAGSLKEQVTEALKQVFDPELGINIVDLGLVYHVKVWENVEDSLRWALQST